jgi:hypothetical protein
MAQVVLSVVAAGAGALLAHKFGRNAETDGFLSAYAVYLCSCSPRRPFAWSSSPI